MLGEGLDLLLGLLELGLVELVAGHSRLEFDHFLTHELELNLDLLLLGLEQLDSLARFLQSLVHLVGLVMNKLSLFFEFLLTRVNLALGL